MCRSDVKNIRFVRGPIEMNVVQDIIMTLSENHLRGSINIFLGQVRADQVGNTKVTGIEYEVHKSMAVKELKRILDFVMKKYDIDEIFIVHSDGFVPTGKWSLLVVCSATHRHQAIHATKELIDLMKKHVPIWKKELLQDGSHRWI